MASTRNARPPHGVRPPITGPALTVTQVRSGISAKPKTRGTLRALGLNGIGQTNVLPDRPEIRGMIARVPHLVSVTTSVTTSGATPGATETAASDTGIAAEVDGAPRPASAPDPLLPLTTSPMETPREDP